MAATDEVQSLNWAVKARKVQKTVAVCFKFKTLRLGSYSHHMVTLIEWLRVMLEKEFVTFKKLELHA